MDSEVKHIYFDDSLGIQYFINYATDRRIKIMK